MTASLLQLGDEAQKRSDPFAAAGFYSRARDEQPDAHAVLLRLGTALIDLHAYGQAIELFRQAQATAPDDPEIAFRLGELYLKSGDGLAALDQFETSLKNRRDDPRVYNAIGVAYSMQRRYDLAQKYYREGLRIAPGQARLLNNLALAQYLAGDDAHARETLASLAGRADSTERQRQNLALLDTLSEGRSGDRAAILGVHFAGDAGSAPALAASQPQPASERVAKLVAPPPPPAPAAALATSVAPVPGDTKLATSLNAIQPSAAPAPIAPATPVTTETKRAAPDTEAAAPAMPALPLAPVQLEATLAPPPEPPAEPARPVAPSPATMPVPVPPAEAKTNLAATLNAIRPTEAPAAPEMVGPPAPPQAAAAAKPAPRYAVAFHAPEEPYAVRYYYCVRSAVPIDHDTAEQHSEIAHTAFSIAPQIFKFRGDAVTSDEAATPDPAPARYTVQFAAFTSERNAARFVERLEHSGVAAKVVLFPRGERAPNRTTEAPPRPRAEPEKLVL
jgi:Flp pilus assembly protein TadD